jgi:hypothetical protein
MKRNICQTLLAAILIFTTTSAVPVSKTSQNDTDTHSRNLLVAKDNKSINDIIYYWYTIDCVYYAYYTVEEILIYLEENYPGYNFSTTNSSGSIVFLQGYVVMSCTATLYIVIYRTEE